MLKQDWDGTVDFKGRFKIRDGGRVMPQIKSVPRFHDEELSRARLGQRRMFLSGLQPDQAEAGTTLNSWIHLRKQEIEDHVAALMSSEVAYDSALECDAINKSLDYAHMLKLKKKKKYDLHISGAIANIWTDVRAQMI